MFRRNITINIKHADSLLKCKKEIKNKNKKEDKLVVLVAGNYTDNVNTSKVKNINKVIREKCFNCNRKKWIFFFF